jgi:ATP-dependent RNA helicase SUPV3L1/SUV3
VSVREHQVQGLVLALLGPTNTGKTHRAISRMLEFESGMMGLPLRLLAREVYDRVSTKIGEESVALVTGEEKRIPHRPRYFICTVEAMPRDLSVQFLAVDEVQLMAHPERGHVFTDRVLHWRGSVETWFLGALSAERLLRTWVPGLRVQRLPRLSQLAHVGQSSLRTLPRRSAVVAFSLPAVYELADALRARRGGAAVVLGALSPRVRNAQVALYQTGEVDFLVATDAIGMGLNLDIDHVALSARIKFDGFEVRELEPPELAQIVGRAGRYLHDGTFGTLAPEPELPPRWVEQLEQHRFPSLKLAFYRNAELDFTSVASLLKSLERRPALPGLTLPPDTDDLLVLRVLAKKPDVLALADRPSRVRALWEVCRIPNYEKRIPEHQAERIVPLFMSLVNEGRLDGELVSRELLRLARFDGDIHQFMERLAATRTWTYASHQSGWLADAADFQARARELEDKLSDTLHQRLLERFVAHDRERRANRVSDERVRAAAFSRPFEKLRQHELYVSEESARDDAQRGWAERLVEARFDELELELTGDLTFEGERVAKLASGPTLQRPTLKPLVPPWVSPGTRARIERRITAHTRDLIAYLFEPLTFGARASAQVRGLAYQLEQSLGTAAKVEAKEQLEALTQEDRALLHTHHVVIGRYCVFARDMMVPKRRTLRFAACRVAEGDVRAFNAFAEVAYEALFLERPRLSERRTLLALGFVPIGAFALRCDVLESLAESLTGKADDEKRSEVENLLGCTPELAARLVLTLATKRKRRRRRS